MADDAQGATTPNALETDLKLKHLARFLAKLGGVFAAKDEVPTKTSQLTNDSGYLTVAGVRTWDDLPD